MVCGLIDKQMAVGIGNNPGLKKAYQPIEYTPEMTSEFLLCMKDPIHFIKNWVKIQHPVKGEIPFLLYPYQEEMVRAFADNRLVVTLMSRQSGKSIDLDTPILTPKGFVRNGDLKVGDVIYGKDGKETTVTFISEQRNDMRQYELTFDNGQSIKACEYHRWVFNSLNYTNVEGSTQEMIDQFDQLDQIWIDINNPVNFNYVEVDDPYSVGLDILNTNLIPDCYIYNSIDVRLSLLQGIMDSHGNVVLGGNCELSLNSEELIDRIRLVLSTLGIKTTKTIELNQPKLTFVVPTSKCELFRIPAKLTMQRLMCDEHIDNERIYLKSYNELVDDKVMMQCLTVDNDDHMFLCSETLIPTHNTQTAACYLLWRGIFNEDQTILIASNKNSNAKEIIQRIQYVYERLPDWIKPGLISYTKHSLEFDNGTRILSQATTENTGRGLSISCVSTKNTLVTVRDKETGEILHLTPSELMQLNDSNQGE